MDDWSETTNSPISQRSSPRRSRERATTPPGPRHRRAATPALGPGWTGRFPPPQKACHASPLDDIHTRGPRNKLSGKAIARVIRGRARHASAGARTPTRTRPGMTGPHRHLTPPTLRADPRGTPALPRRGDAPTGPHPHSATSSPQHAAPARRAPTIGTAGHTVGTPRHADRAVRAPLPDPPHTRRHHYDLRKYRLPEHNRILV